MKNLLSKSKTVILNFIKGIAIGVAMIVPGVSGGTLALIMGIYADIIEAINGLFKHFGKSMKILIPILLGALVGFLGLVTPIKYGLEHCPLIVVTLFAGLIVGGIPTLYRKVRGHESVKGFSLSFVSIAFMIGICFLVSLLTISLTNISFGLWMYLLLAGFVIAMALVMPGISGSMMLMVMGLYDSILGVIDQLKHFENLGENLLIILPIALGAVIGFFVISYIMGKLLQKHEVGTYFVIIGLVIGSLASIYYLSFQKYNIVFDALQISLSIVCFIIGGAFTYFIDYIVNKKSSKSNNTVEEVSTDETR